MSTMTILTGSDRMNSVLWRSDTPQPVNYSPYGTSDADAPGGIGFNGERRDPVSGTTHLGNGYRSYSPALMRFTCPDSLSPFGAGGINPYAYCAGDPINHADPTGHMSTGQGVAMGMGILAGILLGIVTAGAALPVVLAADVAGGAVIGAGSELAAEGIDHQRINWGAVGISAGLGAAMASVGFGLGRAAQGISRATRQGYTRIAETSASESVGLEELGSRGGLGEAEEYLRDPGKFTHEVTEYKPGKFTVSSIDETAGLNADEEEANQFFNKIRAGKWTFIGNFREEKNVAYHADDVFYYQYNMVKDRLGNAMPKIIKRESVLNPATNRMTEGKNGEGLLNAFFETPNGKSTRRIMNRYGLTAREVVRRPSDIEGRYDYLIYL